MRKRSVMMNEGDLQYYNRLARDFREIGHSSTAKDIEDLVEEVRKLQGQISHYSITQRQALIAANNLRRMLGGRD